jgi:cytochrome c oxidase subunit 3
MQGVEYYYAPFSIADNVAGATFYMATGFHGFHVIIGTVMISVSLYRVLEGHFTPKHHFGFECAAWY